MNILQAPFPWFGGKSRVADLVWQRFGDVPNYVEPFFGSGAVLLGRPHAPHTETINDLDGFVANFWRAVSMDAQAVAGWADNPVNENDLSARHLWLIEERERLQSRLSADPHYYNAQIAGWWVWGLCCWIGSGWCSGDGPWRNVNGLLADVRKLPHLGNDGRGVIKGGLLEWFEGLQTRLERVRVCSGDWSRVCGPSVTHKHGLTGVFLDPPYDQDLRADVYTVETNVSAAVREWAIENGSNPLLRIALCGYDGEHAMPDDWECVSWKAHGGFGSQAVFTARGRDNATKERIWFSPHSLSGRQSSLF